MLRPGRGTAHTKTKWKKRPRAPAHKGLNGLPQRGKQRQGQAHRLCLDGPKDGVGSSSFLPFFLSFFLFFFFFNKRGDKGSCQEALSSKV